MKTYYYIGDMGHIKSTEAEGYELSYKLRKIMGNYFETYLEAEAYIDYLLAKEVIKEDTKGFEPNWTDEVENRYRGCWDFKKGITSWVYEFGAFKEPLIFFKSVKDIKESFKKHPKEWKTYLTYKK